YGGEEFLAILPGASRAEALDIGERLRQSIEQLAINADGIDLKVTASIGVACLGTDNETAEQLLEHADQALYQAKAKGRNRVGIHPLAPAGT
ncbi:GGDEF domain-containing protein, partial [Dokdonella sp.]|uniref:GGDEF domain-containing protein n=1 Tax=Dokdonella sp. TaxID=2291710 RepID=UPI003C34E140